jgi:hypothetical protein
VLHYFSDVKYKNEAVLAEAFRLTVNSLLHDKEPPVKVIYILKKDFKLPLLKCNTSLLWIRIRIRTQWGPLIRIQIQEGKNDPQIKKKVNKFNFFKCWMFCFLG